MGADDLPPHCAVVKKSGSLNFLDPSGPVMGELFFPPKRQDSFAFMCLNFQSFEMKQISLIKSFGCIFCLFLFLFFFSSFFPVVFIFIFCVSFFLHYIFFFFPVFLPELGKVLF